MQQLGRVGGAFFLPLESTRLAPHSGEGDRGEEGRLHGPLSRAPGPTSLSWCSLRDLSPTKVAQSPLLPLPTNHTPQPAGAHRPWTRSLFLWSLSSQTGPSNPPKPRELSKLTGGRGLTGGPQEPVSTGSQGSFPEEVSGGRVSGAPEGGRGLVGAGKRASWEESVEWERTGLQSLKRVFCVCVCVCVFFFTYFLMAIGSH